MILLLISCTGAVPTLADVGTESPPPDTTPIDISEQRQDIDYIVVRVDALDFYLADQELVEAGASPKGWVQPPLTMYQRHPRSYVPLKKD